MEVSSTLDEIQVEPPKNAVNDLSAFFANLPNPNAITVVGLWPDRPHEMEPDAPPRYPKATFCDNPDTAASLALKWNREGYNAYFLANVTDGPVRVEKIAKKGPNTGNPFTVQVKPSDEHISLVRMLYVDADQLDGMTVEQSKAHFLELFAQMGNPPSMIVDSGNGLQAYWFLEEPITDPGGIAGVGDYLRGLIAELGTDVAVQDPSRILRCPYTVNWPSKVKQDKGRVPVVASLVYQTDKTYDVEEFEPVAPTVKAGKVSLERTHVEGGSLSLEELGLDINKRSDNELVWLILYRPREWVTGTGDFEGWPHLVGMFPHEAEDVFKDNPKRLGMLQPGADRSPRVFAVTMGLAQRGVAPEHIVALLTDPSWPISAHVLDQGDPVGYAWRQVERALARLPEKVEPAPVANVEAPAASQTLDEVFKLKPVKLFPIPHDLPPSPELVADLLTDGAVTIVGGRGGVGKSLLQLHIAVGCASGKPTLHWDAPRDEKKCKVLVINNEDNDREKQHRLWAICQQMGLSEEEQLDMADRLVTLTYGRNVAMFKAEVDRETNVRSIEETKFFTRLDALIEEEGFDLIIMDPLAELFEDIDENSNSDMKQVIIGIRGLAIKRNIPIMLAHHTRKGYSAEGSEQDAFRGAGAIINHARWAILMEAMRDEQAKEVLAPGERREHHVVLFNAKANYGEFMGAAQILKRHTHEHATAGRRGAFEAIAAKEALPPDAPVEALGDIREAVLDLLRERRDNNSTPFMAAKRAGKDTRLDWAIVNRLGQTIEQARSIIAILTKSGHIKIDDWKNDKREVKQVYILNKEQAGHGLVADACIPF